MNQRIFTTSSYLDCIYSLVRTKVVSYCRVEGRKDDHGMTNAIHPKLNLGVRSLESSTASFVSVDTQWLELFCRAFFFETQICDARNSWTRKIYCKVKFEATVVPQSLLDSTTCPRLEHIQTRRDGMRADRVGMW